MAQPPFADMDRFQVILPDTTNRAIELCIAQVDKQIEELDDQRAKLHDLRAHMARTIGANRSGGTRMQRILDSASQSMKEGHGADIERELQIETARSLGQDIGNDIEKAKLAPGTVLPPSASAKPAANG